jgi:hypothetical protein
MAGGKTYIYVEDVMPRSKYWALAEGSTTILKNVEDNERVAVFGDDSASFKSDGVWDRRERGDMKIADFVEMIVGLVQ